MEKSTNKIEIMGLTIELNIQLLIIVLFLIVVASIFSDHFMAPVGILMSPGVMGLIAALVCLTTKRINPLLMAALTYLFIGLNDIGIKLYGGGIHDGEGQGFINMFLFIGLVPTFLFLIMGVFRTNLTNIFTKILSIFLFVGLVALHLWLFGWLGLGRVYI